MNLRFPIRNNIAAPCSQSVASGFRLTQNERSLYTCTLLQCTDIMHHKTDNQDASPGRQPKDRSLLSSAQEITIKLPYACTLHQCAKNQARSSSKTIVSRISIRVIDMRKNRMPPPKIAALTGTQNVQNQPVKSFPLSFLEHRVLPIALTISILYGMANQKSVFLGGVHRGLGIGAFPGTQNVQNQPVKSFPLSFLEHRVSPITLTVSILCARAGPESVFLGGVHRGLGIGAFPDTQNVQNQPVKSFPLSFSEHRVSFIALTVSILCARAGPESVFLDGVHRGLD